MPPGLDPPPTRYWQSLVLAYVYNQIKKQESAFKETCWVSNTSRDKQASRHRSDMASYSLSSQSGVSHDLLNDISTIHAERSPSTPIEHTSSNYYFVNYLHPSEAGTRQNRKKVRSLISRRQHQQQRSLALRAKRFNDKGHTGGDWLQSGSAGELPNMHRPAYSTLPDETQTSTVISTDDSITIYNDGA